MNSKKLSYIKNTLFPSFVFSLITGFLTGAVIFLFKICSSLVTRVSADIYGYVRENPVWLPCLILGTAVLGLGSALLLKNAKECRGGGIPTSVAILRGLIEFRFLKNILVLFASSLISFFGGIPLGNEGPSVQMGTAIGRGTVTLFGKQHKAWDRYTMTGGACGGFAVATGAPLSGILFAFEEAHRRFSPLLFITASVSVASATLTMRALCNLSNTSSYMFHFLENDTLPLRYIWIAAAVGIVCGLLAIVFTRLYGIIGNFLNTKLGAIPFTAKIIIIFVLVGLLGFASSGLIGSGHDIIEALATGGGAWYLLIIYLCIRALVLIISNRSGITGGMFVPTLTFGAIIGALISKTFSAAELLPKEYFVIPIIIGMASFLSASARTPITAIAFAIEALSAQVNILAVSIGVILAFLIIEIWGVTSLNDTVINQKLTELNKEKASTVVDCFVRVRANSFAEGKEVRDILWPPTCTVLSIKKGSQNGAQSHGGIMNEGDILHIHYQTYNNSYTFAVIEDIVGIQDDTCDSEKHTVNPKNHIVPEI